MRVFIGIDFDAAVKDYIQAVQSYLKSTAIGGNFTKYDNVHLTLRYIGLVELTQIDRISELLDDIALKYHPFPITIGDLGSFGKGEKKLMYVSVKRGKETLQQIDASLRPALIESELPFDEKKLVPHITVAREVRFNNRINPAHPMPFYDKEIIVSTLTLFASIRRDGVLRYEPLHRARLRT